MDRRSTTAAMTQRTPKRRAFGTKLSANSPLPSQSSTSKSLSSSAQQQQQQQQQSSSSRSAKKAQLIPPRSNSKTAERGVQKKRISHENEEGTSTSTTSDIYDDTLGGTAALTPYNDDYGKNVQWSTAVTTVEPASEQRGKNLMDNFNSPSTINQNGVVGVGDATTWTKFTPKIAWKGFSNHPSSSDASMKNAPTPSSVSSSNSLAYSTISATTLSYPPEKLAPSPQPSSSSWESPPLSNVSPLLPPQQNQISTPPLSSSKSIPLTALALTGLQTNPSPTARTAAAAPTNAVISPTASLVSTFSTSTTTTNATTLAASATISLPTSMEPSEYAMRFPPGPLNLLLEPVTITSGRPTGCSIAKILPFQKDPVYLRRALGSPNENTSPPSTIQVNDLVVSINNISVLSRKYEIIINLLDKFQNSEKIVVFRSIERVWRNKKRGDHFQSKTMRNVRNGRRVATALNQDVMEGDLHSWVETPTRVEVDRRRRRRNELDGTSGVNNNKGGGVDRESRGEQRHESAPTVEGQIESNIGNNPPPLVVHTGQKLESIRETTATASSPTDSVFSFAPMTPSTLGSHGPTSALSSTVSASGRSFLFSPSNVKKILTSRSTVISRDSSSPMAAVSTPASSRSFQTPKGEAEVAKTVKKSNVRSQSRLSDGGGGEASSNGALVAKESNVGRSIKLDGTLEKSEGNNSGKKIGSSSKRNGKDLTDRIGKVLVGKENAGKGGGFEHSLRLKKGVLGELKNVHLELQKLRAANAEKEEQLNVMSNQLTKKEVAVEGLQQKLYAAYQGTTISSSLHEKEKKRFQERDAALAGKVQRLVSHLVEHGKPMSLESSPQHKLDKVAVLEEWVAKAELERDDVRVELEELEVEHQLTLAMVNAQLAEAKADADAARKALEEEKRSYSQRDASYAEKTASLEGRIEQEVARLEERIAAAEFERIELEEEHRSALAAVTAELAEAKHDVDAAREALDEERRSFYQRDASYAEQVRGLEEGLEDEKQKFRKSARDQSVKVANLEERIAAAESERDGVRGELEGEHRSALAAVNVELTEAKKDIDAAREALEEERRSSGRRDASYVEQVHSLEERLKQDVAQLEERIAAAESARIELEEEHRSALAAVNVELAEAKNDFDAAREALAEERLMSSERDASYAEQVRVLEGRLEQAEAGLEERIAAAESERTKLEQEHQLKLAVSNAKSAAAKADIDSAREALEEERQSSSQRDASYGAQVRSLEELLEQDRKLLEERTVAAELERARLVEEHQSTLAALNADLAEAKADVDAARATLEEERRSSSQRDACYMEQVRNLEVRLEHEEKRLEEHIAVAELERAELAEEHQSTLAALNADLVEANNDVDAARGALEEERQNSNQREASYVEQVQSLEVRLEYEEKRSEERISVAESERIESEEEHRLLLARVTAELVEAKTDLTTTRDALDEERKSFYQREASYAEQVRGLEEGLEGEKRKSLESTQTQLGIVANFEKRIAAAKSEQEVVLTELKEEHRSALALVNVELAKAKADADAAREALDEERRSFCQRDASNVDQVRILEERLEQERKKAVESAKDQSNMVANGEERIAGLESDRDSLRLELKSERLALSVFEANLAKAKEEAEEEKLRSSKRDTSYVDQVRSLEEQLEEEKQKAVKAAKDQSIVVEQLEERITIAESDLAREDLRREVEKEQLVRAKQDAEEELISSQRAHAEQVLRLELCLEEEKKNVMKNTTNQSIIVANLEERIAGIVLERDRIQLELQNERSALSALKADFAKAKEEAEEENLSLKLGLSHRDASYTERLHSFEECLEVEKRKAIETAKDQSAIVAKLEERIVGAESDGEALLLNLEDDQLLFLEREEKAKAEILQLLGKEEQNGTSRSKAICTELRIDLEFLKAHHQNAIKKIKSLESQQTTLNDFIKVLGNERESLRADSAGRKACIESLETERSHLIGRIRMLELEDSERNLSLTNKELEVRSISSTLKETREEIELLKSDRQQLERQINDMKNKLSLTELKVNSERGVFEKNECALVEQIDSLSAQLLATEGWKSFLQSRVETLVADLAGKEKSLVSLTEKEVEIVALQSSQSSLQQKLADATSKLESSRSDAETSQSKLLSEVRELSERLATSQSDASQSRALCAAFKSKLEKTEVLLDDSYAEIQSLSSDCQRLDNQVSKLTDENQSLTSELKSRQSKNEILGERVREIISQVQMKEEAQLSSQLNYHYENQKKIIVDLSSKLETTEASLGETTAEMERLSHDRECLLKKVNDITALLENSDETNFKQKCENLSLTTDISSAFDSVDNLRTENQSLVSENESLGEGVRNLTNEVETVSSTQSRLDNEVEERTKRLEVSRNDAHQSNGSSTDLRSKLDLAESIIDKTNDKLRAFEKEANDLNLLSNSNAEALAQYKSENQTLATKLTSITASRNELLSEKESLASEVGVKSDEVRELTNQLQIKSASLTSSQNKHDAEVGVLMKRLETSQNDVLQSESLCADLRSKLLSAEDIFVENNAELERLSHDREHLEKQVNDLTVLLQDSVDALSRQKDEYESLAASRVELVCENVSMASKISSLSERTRELTAQETNHKTKVRELTESLEASQSDSFQSKALAADLRPKLDLAESLVDKTNVEMREQVNDLNILLENGEEAILRQKDENRSLAAKLASVTASRNELCQERELVAADLKAKRSEITILSDKVCELTNQVQLNTEKLSSSQMKLNESQNDSFQSKAVVTGLRSKLVTAEAQIDEANAKIQYLENQVSGLDIIATSRDELSCKNVSISSELKSSQLKNDSLSTRVFELTREDIRHEAEVRELVKSLEASQSNACQSKALSADLRSKLDLSEHLVDKTKTEMRVLQARLEKEVVDLDALLEVSMNAISQHQVEKKSLVTELASVTASRNDLLFKQDSLASEFSAKADEVRELSNKLQLEAANGSELLENLKESQHDARQSKALCDDFRTKLDISETLLSESNCEIQSLLTHRTRLEKQVNDFTDEVESLTTELACVYGTRDALRTEIELMSVILESKQRAITSMSKRVQEMTNKLELDAETQASSQIKHDGEMKELTKRLEESRHDACQRKALSADAQSKLEIAETEIHNIRERSEKQLNNLHVLLEKSKEAAHHQKCENLSLAAELASVTASRDDVLSDKDSMATELKSRVAEICGLRDRVQVLTNQIDSDKTELSSKLYAMENHMESQHASIASKDAEISSLLCELGDLKKTFDDLEIKTREAEAQSQIQSDIELQLSSKEAEISSLAYEKEGLAEAVKKLEVEVERIQALSRRETLSHKVNQSQLLNEIRDLRNALSGSKIKLELSAKETKRLEEGFNCKEKVLSTLVTTLQREIQKEKARYTEIQVKFDAQEQEVCRMECERSSTKESIKEWKVSKDALEASLDDARTERGRLKEQIQYLQREMNHQKQCNVEHESKIAADLELAKQAEQCVRDQLVTLNRSLEEKVQEISALNYSVISAEEDRRQEIAEITTEKETLHKNLANAEAEKSHITAELNEFAEQFAVATQKEKELDCLLKTRQNEVDILTIDLNSVKMSHEKSLADMVNLHASNVEKMRRIHDKESNELQEHISNLTLELQACKDETDKLRSMLEEGISLNSEKSLETKKLRAELKSMVEKNAETESKSVREKQNMMDEINQKQATIDSQNIAMEKANQTKVLLQSKLQETQLELTQLSANLACARVDIATAITEAKKFAEEAIRHVVSTFEEEKERLQCEMHLLQQKKDLDEELLIKNKDIEASAKMLSLENKIGNIEGARLVLVSQNAEMKSLFRQQEENKRNQYQSELEFMSKALKSREKSIERFSVDWQLAQDEIVCLRAEVECAKEIGQHEVLSTRKEFEDKLNLLSKKFENDKSSLQTAARLVACIQEQEEIIELPLEALPEMTSLLNTLFELFHDKKDQISSLQAELRNLNTLKADRASQLETLVGEINYMHTRLENQTASSQRVDECQTIMNTVEHKLRDLCIHLDVQTVKEVQGLSQSEAIHEMLQLLELTVNAESDKKNLSKIDQIKQKLVDMSHKLESEVNCRKKSEMQCIAGEEALVHAKEQILILEQRVRDMDVRSQLKTKEAKDLESHLEQVKCHQRKSEHKYERAQTEIESCQKLANELKNMIFEKNKELESKENLVLTLQYKIDDLSSRSDGWKASFEGMVTDAGNNVSPPEDAATILVASTERQDALSSEKEKLEKKIMHMNEDQRQQISMHRAIVDGIESQCEMLSEENADMCDELRVKEDYICDLEEAKERIEVILDEERNKSHDIQRECLQQVKDVKYLTDITIVHAAKLEGFPSNLLSPSTWSENMECIARFIDNANEEICRLQTSTKHRVTAEEVTPRTKGSNGSISVINFASQHLDVLDDLMNTKKAIANILSSPQMTPMKSDRHEEGKVQINEGCAEDILYSDLLRAHEQLEILSEKIKTFQDNQRHLEERESYFQSRIVELEQRGPHLLLETDQRMKEAGIVMMCSFQQRFQRGVMQHAFQTWNSQVRMSKHMTIAREMAKELVKTRKKVLLLKSHIDE